MSHPWRDFLVGLTVALGVAGVAVLLMMFGEIATGRPERYPLTLEIGDATGLTKSSRVTLNGVDIGAVRSIRSREDPRDGVRIALEVNEGTRVPRSASVIIQRDLVGDASLALTATRVPETPDDGFLAPGDTLTTSAKGMFDVLGEAIDERLSAFADAATSFQAMSETLNELGRSAQEALAPRTPEEVDAGARATLSSTLARLDRAIAEAQNWLGDDDLRSDLRRSLSRATDLMDEASLTLEEWKSAAGTLTSRADEVGDSVENAVREFASATRALGEAMLEVQTLVAGVNRGEGTAGMLAKNPDLYRSLNDAAVRLEKALTEAQLLIEKFRKEGVPVQF